MINILCNTNKLLFKGNWVHKKTKQYTRTQIFVGVCVCVWVEGGGVTSPTSLKQIYKLGLIGELLDGLVYFYRKTYRINCSNGKILYLLVFYPKK